MPPTIQTRPGKLDWRAYPGQQRVLRLAGWDPGYIDGRTYELRIRGLDVVDGVLDTDADTVTFTVDLPEIGGTKKLTIVDTSVDPEDVIIRGEVYVSDSSTGGAESDTEVSVTTVDEVTIDLTVTVLAGTGGGGGGSVNSVGATAPITSTGGTDPVIGISAASGSAAGSMSAAHFTKLQGIEAGAEVNNLSDGQATDLTDGGDSSAHFHSADRNRSNHTGSQPASTISDFDTEVANNADVAANTAARHTHSNQSVLNATTASFTTADETKLDHLTVTQAVDLDAIETRVNDLDAAVVLRGTWDASAGSFPGGGTAQAGSSYIVSVAGTVDAVAFTVGDRVIAITDNASTTTFANNWFKADYTDQVLSVNGQTGVVTLGTAQVVAADDITNTLLANMAQATIKGRASGAGTGDPTDLTATQARAILNVEDGADVTDATNVDAAGAVMNSDYDANTILAANSDNTPVALTVAEQRLVGRITGGSIDDLTTAQVITLLGILTAVEGNRIDITPSGSNLTFDVDLTEGIAGGDTLVGGNASGNNLSLASTSHATRGRITIRDPITVITENKTSTAGTASTVIYYPSTTTYTLQESAVNAGNQVYALLFESTIEVGAGGPLTEGSLFDNRAVYKNPNASAVSAFGVVGFRNQPTIRGDGAAFSTAVISFRDQVTVERINSGTATLSALTTVESNATVSTGGTVTLRTGYAYKEATVSGTLTTQIGVDIAALSLAGTNIGIRNASTTVCTPLANSNITATSATIRNDASTVTLTANNSYTLASTPTIADGQNGQRLRIINVDTADTITLQDQGTLGSSNLRLAANTIALGPRDSIDLEFNSTVGDWVQVGQTNVL